jgi:allantoate deiminase
MMDVDQQGLKMAYQRALQRCQILAGFSELQGGILRQYLSVQHQQANQQVAEWMSELGMRTWQDPVGNIWGRWAATDPQAKSLIIGSHLDTVTNAGAYDGILGVMIGIELVALLQQQQRKLPFHLDIVGFADEEGTRFGCTLIGSSALAGHFDPRWLEKRDQNGISMAQAMAKFGLDPNLVEQASLSAENIIGYWEAHIEQGPVLENREAPVGVVTAIAGARRAKVRFTGQAGHAGTTPMALRKDSVAAAAEWVCHVEQLTAAKADGEVATVGQFNVLHGSVNVIAGVCELSLDVRAQSDKHRDKLIDELEQAAHKIGQQRAIEVSFNWYHSAPAVECDAVQLPLFVAAAEQCGYSAPLLPSGAGHDAMALASLCPVNMLFLRSPEGISHHPDERVIAEDVGAAIAVLWRALLLIQ